MTESLKLTGKQGFVLKKIFKILSFYPDHHLFFVIGTGNRYTNVSSLMVYP